MNKQELIKRLSEKVDVPQKKVAEIVAETFNLIDGTVATGETVCVNGRRFKHATRKARSCRNPRTQEVIQIPERKYIVYRKRIG